ncbi:hypothetical protein J4470_01455 [Candidatus Woesearchaeota archaeon]|nr:hypothetical protein [Candidatus Woesearchaeota archaeon]
MGMRTYVKNTRANARNLRFLSTVKNVPFLMSPGRVFEHVSEALASEHHQKPKVSETQKRWQLTAC